MRYSKTTMSAHDIRRVENAVRTVHVDNETVEWDCQEYVLDILQKLEDEFDVEEAIRGK